MDNFKVVYKILKELEAAMDYEMFDQSRISPEKLKITEERRDALLIEMQLSGYIRGLVLSKSLGGSKLEIVEPICPTITLNGLEYLSENSVMKRIANGAKGIAEIVGGVI